MVMKERDIFANKAKMAKQVSDTVRGLLALPVFCDVQKQLTFFDVAPEEFTHTEAYAKLHGIMLRFLRARFWWVGDEGDGWWKMPRLRLNDDGTSRWERKYSMVYENWCHAHLILAFRELGYEGKEMESPLPGCKGSCWRFRKDDIEVFVQHAVLAERFDENHPSSRAFVVVPGDSDQLEPDFAIVVKRRGRPEVEWFVADAKSDFNLKPHMVGKRCVYAKDLRWASGPDYRPRPGDDYDGKRPFASILFRSGRTEEAPGVEMPPPPVPDFVGNDHSKDKYEWGGTNGVKTRRPTPPYHGHLRVNVVSLKNRTDIFREFVAGMIATACRHLSAYRCPKRSDSHKHQFV